MKKTYLGLLLVSLSILTSAAKAAEKVKVGSFPIPLMVEAADKGVFVDLAKEIAKRADLEFEITVQPPARTVDEFLSGKFDVIFPALDVNFPADKKPLKSKELIYVKHDFAFTKKGAKMLKKIPDLKGKTVGITLGYPYVKELTDNTAIKFDVGANDEMNAQKLAAGRLDAFVVEEKSGLEAFKKAAVGDQIQYDPKTPLSKQDVYFAVQKGGKGPSIEAKISKALAEMKKDGTFDKLMGKTK